MKYLAMVVLNPNIKEKKLEYMQGGIVNLFEQKSNVKKTYFLGKKKLEYPVKKYTEGYYLKFEIETSEKKVLQIKELLKANSNVIFHFIINNEHAVSTLPILRKIKRPFNSLPSPKHLQADVSCSKVYMLISKNVKLPFSESNILAISHNIDNLLQLASKKFQEYVYVKGFHTVKELHNMKDIENELKKYWRVQFALDNNLNVGQELLIQERNLI